MVQPAHLTGIIHTALSLYSSYRMEGHFGVGKFGELSAEPTLAEIKFGELLYGVHVPHYFNLSHVTCILTYTSDIKYRDESVK